MKKSILIFTAFFFLLMGAQADSFDSANEAYATGKYADAVHDLEDLAARKEYSAPLFYNLANAYFRMGRTGEAVLNYERALWLNPGDPDAKANLRFVRKTAGLFEPSREWWQIAPGWMSLDAWSWTACISWFLLATALILRWWNRSAQWSAALKPVIAALVVLLAISLASAIIRAPDARQAIVLASETPLRVAPLEKSASTAALRAGDVVRIGSRRGEFLYVETEDGKAGWTLTGAEVAPVVHD